MPKIDSQKWANAARCIAEGGSQADAAERVGVHVRTVRRWAAADDFKATVAELQERLRPAIALQDESELQQWVSEVRHHISDMQRASVLTRSGGMGSMNKALRRLRDLPDEALRPADAIALLKVGMDMVLQSFDLEARALGIYELAERVAELDKTRDAGDRA